MKEELLLSLLVNMVITVKQLLGNRVVSRSGFFLGKVVDFEIDALYQKIKCYHVQSDIFGFLKKPLIINSEQILEIKEKEVIVEDAAIPEKLLKKGTIPAGT